jgi:hypothetical protein
MPACFLAMSKMVSYILTGQSVWRPVPSVWLGRYVHHILPGLIIWNQPPGGPTEAHTIRASQSLSLVMCHRILGPWAIHLELEFHSADSQLAVHFTGLIIAAQFKLVDVFLSFSNKKKINSIAPLKRKKFSRVLILSRTKIRLRRRKN